MEELPIVLNGKAGKLRGIIHKSSEPCKGIVILLHGYFSSTKLGPVNLYVQIARQFALKGYEFWRFDSYGVGDSDGDFIESNYELRINDYKIITDVALTQSNNIIYLGHSMGTSIAIHLTNCYKKYVNRVFILSPCFGHFTWFENLFTKHQQEILKVNGVVERKGLQITQDFISHLISENIYDEIEKCNVEFIVFYGLLDEFYDKNSIEKALKYMKKLAFEEIDHSDHNFISNRKLLMEKLIPKI